jgi:hypothetical protein
VVEALGAALTGSGRPLVVTSETTVLTPGRLRTEKDAPDASSAGVPRIASEQAVLSMAQLACARRWCACRRPMGWRPNQPALIPDLDRARYSDIHFLRHSG